MDDWRAKHEQHRRVRRWNWRVFSNTSGRAVELKGLPSMPELLLAVLLAAVGTAAWLAWGMA
jgi:hypothetical protein